MEETKLLTLEEDEEFSGLEDDEPEIDKEEEEKEEDDDDWGEDVE